MTKDEALKLALEALEIGLPLIEDFGSTEQFNAQHKAIDAIYEALAQPEQEPVAWIDKMVIDVPNQILYTAPQRTWVGLTDEEIQYCVELKNPEAIAEEVEAKLKEKNT